MVAGLRDGTYTALIMDAHVLEFTVGTNEACDLFLVGGDVFESFSLALAFPPAFSDALVFDFSRSMIKLQVRFACRAGRGQGVLCSGGQGTPPHSTLEERKGVGAEGHAPVSEWCTRHCT